ncbi:MAG: hypothetical protein II648_04835 [Bacteroidales bacterium]|nr:hypothetical protein [Bacteroidales bacterium]
MEYFWMQQDDIPPEMGYPLFGAAHLISVAVTLLLVSIALIVLRKKSGRVQRRALKAIPLVMLVLEVAKDLCRTLYFKKTFTYLTEEELTDLVKQLSRRLSADAHQICRVLGLSYVEVTRLLDRV